MKRRKPAQAKAPAPASGALPLNLEMFFTGLLESTNLVIYLKDETGRYIYVNRRYELVSSIPRDAILGKFDADLFPPEVVKVFRAQDEEVLRRRVPVEFEETLSLPTGLRSFITEKFPLLDGKGRVYAVGGFCTEITTQSHRADETVAAERERLAATLRCIGDGVISTDVNGGVLLMNPTAERLTGRRSAEAVGKPVDQILRPADKSRDGEPGRLVREAVASGAAAADFDVAAAAGGRRRIVLNAAPVRDRTENLIGVVLTLRDVTDQTRLEGELFKASKLESLGLVAGGIAHDFNNLLTGILGNIALARECPESGAEAAAALSEAESAARSAGRLTHQLLTFAKGGDPVRRVIDAAPTVREAATFAARGTSARCVFDFALDAWPVSADSGQLGQVVSNLVINAVQAMPSGGTIIIGLNNEELKADGGLPLPRGPYLRLTVSDGGAGIGPEDLLRIFDPFYTTKATGTGLGLTTCYSIVAKHGGHISADSKPDEGATFTIRLPALPGGTPDEAADLPSSLWRGSGRVLAMDDDPVVASFLSRVLPKLGFEVVLARDGAEAVRLFKKARGAGAPFSAVILDLTVAGGMGGLEALKKLRALDPDAAVIVSSGYSRDPVLASFKKHGFDAALAKPYQAQQLSLVLKSLLERRPRR